MSLMRVSTFNRVLIAACVIVVPASIFGGVVIKEHYLGKAKLPENKNVTDRAMRARVVQLETERKANLKDLEDLNNKIIDLRERMAKKE